MRKVYLEVAVPFPIFQTFFYEFNLEEDIDLQLLIGKKVTVPFNKIQTYGIVLNVSDHLSINIETKPILNIDDTPIYSEKDIEIIKKISDYYITPIGMTFDFFIPNFLKKKKIKDDYLNKVLTLNDEIDLTKYKLTDAQEKVINIISHLKEAYYEEILALGIRKNIIQALIKKDIIKISERKIISLSNNFTFEKEEYPKEDIYIKNKLMLLDEFYLQDRIRFYLNISSKFLKENKSILIVFPYINLLNKFYDLFKSKLTDVYVFHDSMKISDQKNVFKQITSKPSIVLGTVSSLFLPIKNLSLIVIEEENSDIYKVLRTPKVDVKRAAYYIHKEKNIPLILSSSLPSIETFYLKEKKQIHLLKKNNNIIKTKIEIFPFKSLKDIILKIKKITNDKNTLIISNKSYYSGFVFCERCGWEALCPTCNVHLKVYSYKDDKIFKCPLCNKKYEFFKNCPDCDFKLKEVGFGKEKIIELLSDTVKSKKIEVVSTFTTTLNQYDTVININPDFILDLPDFRANDRFFENIVFPLTVAKENYIIFSNLKNKIESMLDKNIDKAIEKFYKSELSFRKENNLPPYSKFVKITIPEKKKDILDDFLKNNFKIRSEFVVSKNRVYIVEFKNESELKILKDKIINISKNLVISVEVNPKNF